MFAVSEGSRYEDANGRWESHSTHTKNIFEWLKGLKDPVPVISPYFGLGEIV